MLSTQKKLTKLVSPSWDIPILLLWQRYIEKTHKLLMKRCFYYLFFTLQYLHHTCITAYKILPKSRPELVVELQPDRCNQSFGVQSSCPQMGSMRQLVMWSGVGEPDLTRPDPADQRPTLLVLGWAGSGSSVSKGVFTKCKIQWSLKYLDYKYSKKLWHIGASYIVIKIIIMLRYFREKCSFYKGNPICISLRYFLQVYCLLHLVFVNLS